MELWNGFKTVKTIISEREAIIVCPEKPNGKWALKTEYFDAFPEVQIELLKMGYYVAHIKNISRWYMPEDTEARVSLAQFMEKQFGVSKKCVIIGMSCGGMQGIIMGALHPEYVSCMYLDAPVVDFNSCPGKIPEMYNECLEKTGMTAEEFKHRREWMLSVIEKLCENRIPVILISGDSDKTVPFDENGKLLKCAYEKAGCTIETYIKEGGDHHPHSLEDNSPIYDFILKYDR